MHCLNVHITTARIGHWWLSINLHYPLPPSTITKLPTTWPHLVANPCWLLSVVTINCWLTFNWLITNRNKNFSFSYFCSYTQIYICAYVKSKMLSHNAEEYTERWKNNLVIMWIQVGWIQSLLYCDTFLRLLTQAETASQKVWYKESKWLQVWGKNQKTDFYLIWSFSISNVHTRLFVDRIPHWMMKMTVSTSKSEGSSKKQ